MKKLLAFVFLCVLLINAAIAGKGDNMDNKPVVEIVIFKVSDLDKGLKAARNIVEEARAFNDAIVSAEIYQSASESNTISQRIVWKSLKAARAAFAASGNFPGMAVLMELTTEHVFIDHFYER